MYGGTRQYLPLKVNQAGVMPIIFASSLLLFPQMIFQYLATAFPGNTVLGALQDSFTRGQSFLYNLLYVALIFFFCYFWTAITFNPKEVADNLKNFGGFSFLVIALASGRPITSNESWSGSRMSVLASLRSLPLSPR